MKELYLKDITIQNYKIFVGKTVSFDKNFNIIIGEPGIGKTTILESITVLLSAYLLGYKTYMSSKNIENIKPSDVRLSDMEPIYPCCISGKFLLDECLKSVSRIRRNENENTRFNGKNVFDNTNFEQLMANADNSDKKEILPVLLYFNPNRLINPKKTTKQRKELEFKFSYNRTDGYYRCLKDLDMDYSYYYLKRMQMISMEERDGKPYPAYSLVMNTLNNVLCDAFDDSQKLVFTTKDGLDKIALKMQNELLVIDKLNTGLQNLIKIILSIMARMCVLNPYLAENALETPGIVLIDELDLALDSIWKQKFIEILKTTFPNVQFICTVNGDLKTNENTINLDN